MSGHVLKCCYCQRDTDKIRNGMIGGFAKERSNAVQEVLFVDTKNRLACGRCISEHDLGLNLNGKAVFLVTSRGKKVEVNRDAIGKADKEPVDLYKDAKPAFLN